MARSPRPNKKKTAPTGVEQVAALYVETRAALVRAGRALHDHVGSSLSAAGVQLQLLRMDVPASQARVDEALRTLEAALDRVRELSHELCPSPAYRGGLKQALLRLTDQHGTVVVDYSSTAMVPAEIAAALYEAAASAVGLAVQQGAGRISISVRGTSRLVVRIADNGRQSGRARGVSLIRTLASAQGLAFESTTGKSTIVSIAYAIRRPARR